MARLAVEGDRTIHYEHYSGSGRPVVLSHGWGQSARAWDGVIPALRANGNAVVAYDHRCCGSSDKDFDDVSVEAMGSDIVALVDHLGLDGPVLNGWSLGGAVVVDAAGKLGDRLGGLVSTCGATPRYTQAEGFEFGGSADDVTGTVAALQADRATFLDGLYSAAVFHADVSPAVKTNAITLALQAGSGADASLGALATVDQRDTMAAITAPALVCLGVHDAVVDPGICRFAADLLPNGTLVEFDNSGHAPMHEEQAKYNETLVGFVNGIG